MESSDSNDSFAWASASSENSSSSSRCDIMAKKNLKQLLAQEDDIKDENVSQHKKKKKKKSSDQYSDIETFQIKKEPESDLDTVAKKKKKKSKHTEHFETDEDSIKLDESYLNLQVKQEKCTFIEPSPVKAITKETKRKRSISNSSGDSHNKSESENAHTESTQHKKSGKKKKHSEQSEECTANNDSIECNRSLNQKVKRKGNTVIGSDSNLAEKKSDIKKIKHRGIANHSYTSKEIIDNDSSSDESTALQHHVTEEKNIASSTFITDVSLNGVHKISKMVKERLISGSNNLPPNVTKQSSKISERIQFEEDEVETNCSQDESSSQGQSILLKRFLKLHNKHLKTVFHGPEENIMLSYNDEIWVLKLPHDLNIKSLIDTNITLDSKSKLKISSQTYEGSLENKDSKMAILIAKDNRFTIENLDVNGTVNFRKRIPKAHYVVDNIIVNNQTNFIPLPDTKCRHPLFGSNYKKAIKLSDSVKERLINKPKKKKKHKRDEQIEVPVEMVVTSVKKKKRKRQHSTDEEDPAPKKVKRVKRDPDTTEAWESAQDIEQKLFNF